MSAYMRDERLCWHCWRARVGKISESQQLVGGAFGAASAATKSQSQTQHPSSGSVNGHRHAITKISSISPDHVFQSSPHHNGNASAGVRQHSLVSSHAGQKSHVFHSPGGAGTTTSTLISIGGQVFSTSKLKPIQLLAAGAGQGDCDGALAGRAGPFTPVKQALPPAASTGASASKYILITSSHGDRAKSVAAGLDEAMLHATPASADQQMGGSLGSGGTPVNIATALASPLPLSQSLSLSSSSSACSDLLVLASSGGHSPQTVCAQRRTHVLGASVSMGAVSPLSPSEQTCGPGSPDLRAFSQSLRRADPGGDCVDDSNENEDDELDLEMDQFLDSYSILDQPQDDGDGDHDDDDMDSSPPDLYKDDIDDYCVWQHDDSFGLQDVEIEIH